MREISAHESVRRLSAAFECGDSKFAFFLGAGCSVSSGIPGAGSLVKKWLPRLKRIKTGSETGADEWAKVYYEEYDGSNPEAIYGKVIEELFDTPAGRQTEIEIICSGKDPGFGYAVLAQFISHEEYCRSCNVILTTNFDDQVADALYLYTNKKPLVITHESLIDFVKITRTGPLVIKLHGDARLAPKNVEVDTKKLEESVKKVLKKLLSETGLIFLGYGGNDKSIAGLLNELPPGSLPWGIYWVNKYIPDGPVGDWLKQRNAYWVKHRGFDEFMLLLWSEFGLEHPEETRFKDLFEKYRASFEKLQKEVESLPGSEDKEALKLAINKVIAEAKDWWAVELEARKYKESDPAKADDIYVAGVEKFPYSHELMGNYANFLKNIRKDYDGAEEYYKRALEADPYNVKNLGNYANFLTTIRKDHDEAEPYYKRALEGDPDDANNLGNYANFLTTIRKDHDEAEAYYKRALEADPDHASNLGNYANFLTDIRKAYDEAEAHYKRALEANPNHANNLGLYAVFLEDIRKDYDGAEGYYKRALEADPDRAATLNNYAGFLKNIRKDYNGAEGYYKRALEADQDSAIILGNYGGFSLARGKPAEGFDFLARALEVAEEPLLILECRFYYYAHTADEKERLANLKYLKSLIVEGVRSPGWDLSLNVSRAKEVGHPEPELLETLGRVIVEEEDADLLDKFPAWDTPS